MGSLCSCVRSEEDPSDGNLDVEVLCQPAREQMHAVAVEPHARDPRISCQSYPPCQTTSNKRLQDQNPASSTNDFNYLCVTNLPSVNTQNGIYDVSCLDNSSERTQDDIRCMKNPGTSTSKRGRKRRNRSRSKSRKENSPPHTQGISISRAEQIAGLKTLKIAEGEIKKTLPKNWSVRGKFPMPHCELVELPVNHPEYIKVTALFTATIPDRIIESICRIENPYLWYMYLLKKEENEKLYGDCNEMNQFHSTKSENVTSICLNNFDWRRFGSNVGHKFGQGVSFSSLASYASFYCDGAECFNKMFLVRVLFSNICVGKKDTMLPPAGFDTTIGKQGRVCVKYDDNSFYPEYLISFSGRLKNIRA